MTKPVIFGITPEFMARDGLFDIYLVRIGNHGEVHSHPPDCENRPSYMLINGASTQLRGTLLHEFMNAIIARSSGPMAIIGEYVLIRWPF